MEAVILMGLQASGKSTFCKQRFFDTHVRINLDMLKTRNRERRLLHVCFDTGQPFVVDNTNPTRKDRQRYIPAAKSAGFRVVGYYFQSNVEECMQRNDTRCEPDRIPEGGVRSTHRRLQLPRFDEGFDELYHVKIAGTGEFMVNPWSGNAG
ncbi:MAG: AAA family ATPase [Planctomycetota bacterium]